MSSLGEPIRDFYGRIIGYIQDDGVNGDQIGRDFYGRIVGRYNKASNVTRDFYGRIVAKGNTLAALIQRAEDEWQEKQKSLRK